MRTRTIPLTLLTLVLVACVGDAPTAVAPDAGGAAARASASRKALPFHGTLDSATHTPPRYDPQTNTILIDLAGTGTATHLGRYTLTSRLALNPDMTIPWSESMILVAANGDSLFTTGTVLGVPSGDGVTLNSVESATITGGTGRFAGATGSFVLRQVNLALDRVSSGSFDGTITFAH